jgi:hypothetical protein
MPPQSSPQDEESSKKAASIRRLVRVSTGARLPKDGCCQETKDLKGKDNATAHLATANRLIGFVFAQN